METLGKITLFVILLVVGFFVVLLETKIFLSVATLYNLNFITRFSFIQVFGLLGLIGLVTYRYKKTEEENFTESLKNGSIELLTKTCIYLTFWGIAFISYYILK
jgi:hypothetical protein